MRIIFESERMPVTANVPSDADSPLAGTTTDGVAWLCIRTFDGSEAIPKQHDHARPVCRLLQLLSPGEPHRSKVPEVFSAPIALGDAVVPRERLDLLPPDTIIAVDWEFEPLT